jgi:hypothetical protein
MELHI